MATWRVNNSDGCTFWQASHTYEVGDRCIISIAGLPTTSRKYVYRCTVGGESGESEPETWPSSGTVVDNEVTWTTETPTDGTWANASGSLVWLLLGFVLSDGDTILVHDEHAEVMDLIDGKIELYGGAGHLYIICVDKDTEEPSVGASITFDSGVDPLEFRYGIAYSFGISWIMYGPNLDFVDGTSQWVFDGNGGTIMHLPNQTQLSVDVWYGFAWFRNGSIQFDNYVSNFYIGAVSSLSFENVSIVAPNGLQCFINTDDDCGDCYFSECDLTQCGHGADERSLVDLNDNESPTRMLLAENCKLPDPSLHTGFSIVKEGNVADHLGGPFIELYRCASDIGPHVLIVNGKGVATTSLDIYRVDGALETDTHYAIQLVSSSKTYFPSISLEGTPIGVRVSDTEEVTLTLEGIADSATSLTNADISVTVEYPGAADSTLNSVVSSVCLPNATPSNLTTSSETWAGEGGMENPYKFKISVDVTPARIGMILVTVHLWKVSSSVYIDPMITVS